MSLWIILEACRQLFQQKSHAFQTPRCRGWLGLNPWDVDTGSLIKADAQRGSAILEGCEWGAFLLPPTPRLARFFSDKTGTLCRGGFSPVVDGCWRAGWWWGVWSLPLFHFSRCLLFGFVLVWLFFSCSWPDGLCGERCQIMKPVSKAGIWIL